MDQQTKNSAILDLAEIGAENEPYTTTHHFESALPNSALDDEDEDIDKFSESRPASHNFWSLSYYQQFFDVDSDEVLKRLLWSAIPRPNFTASFFKTTIRRKPDIYGPFWICVTLIMSVAISGNIASYLQTKMRSSWHYNFHKVTAVSSTVFGYALCVPVILFLIIYWVRSRTVNHRDDQEPLDPSSRDKSLGLLELFCVYGYCMSVYIPVSVLWLIQNAALQWIFVALAFGLSGGVLALSLWPDLSKKSKKLGLALILLVLVFHLLLSCGFMLWFFYSPTSNALSPLQEEGQQMSEQKSGLDSDHLQEEANRQKAEAKTKREPQNASDPIDYEDHNNSKPLVEDHQKLKLIVESNLLEH